MEDDLKTFKPEIPSLDLAEDGEMLKDFSREAQRHLIAARNSLLVLETVATDKEAVESIFKTFHTIKGLSDFLRLRDICALTRTAEAVLDACRKGQISFDERVLETVREAVDGLQTLLDLLDRQIAAGGTLKEPYFDAGGVIASLESLKTSSIGAKPAHPADRGRKPAPVIQAAPEASFFREIEGRLTDDGKPISLSPEEFRRLRGEFKVLENEVKLIRGKLQERQRELIRERELALRLTEQAQAEARAKSEYLASMSHEIRTLINAVLGFTELLQESPLSDKQREHLKTIVVSGRMMLDIVNDILDLAKVEAGRLNLEEIDFHLEELVVEVFRIIRSRLDGKPVDLFYRIAPDVPPFLNGDPTRLKQILINLLDNALKFTERGEVGLEISLESGETALPGRHPLRFVVQDSGIGIPEDRLDRIFDSFCQADDATTRLYGGTGLGLTLCKTFVEKMGGRIWVESEVGRGSRFLFVITLPEGRVGVGHEPAVLSQVLRGRSVLVVEHHPSSSAALSSCCRSLGLEVLGEARTAKQAAEMLLEWERADAPLPEVIVIDLLLPEQQGYMLACKIKQQTRYQSLRLVAASSDIKVESSEEYRQAGFDAFLAKPYIREEVADLFGRLYGTEGATARRFSDDQLEKISCEGIRVLVVEDSAPNQELLKVHFEGLGCVCDFASNGELAIELMKNNTYDLVFMDLQMPVMGGIEAAKVIRGELGSKVPIIALTAAEVAEEREHCLAAGMNDYLVKPFGVEELKAKVVRWARM